MAEETTVTVQAPAETPGQVEAAAAVAVEQAAEAVAVAAAAVEITKDDDKWQRIEHLLQEVKAATADLRAEITSLKAQSSIPPELLTTLEQVAELLAVVAEAELVEAQAEEPKAVESAQVESAARISPVKRVAWV